MRYGTKWPQYKAQWDRMVIAPSRKKEFEHIAQRLVNLKARYTPIEKATGVPWYMVSLIHLRESTNDFTKSLAQGDPWDRRSTHKPISGPFHSFYESALWALAHDGLTKVKDWRLEKILYYMEIYNGAGYDMRGLPSPYIWGGTNVQKHGKFEHDGPDGWNPNAWDHQPGVAAILRTMSTLDSSIKFVRETTPEEDQAAQHSQPSQRQHWWQVWRSK